MDFPHGGSSTMNEGEWKSAYLGSLVLAGGDEVSAVSRPLEVDNGLVELVDGEVVKHIASLGIVLADATVLVSGNDVLGEPAEASDGGLALVADNGQSTLVGLLSLGVGVDVVDDNVGEVTHTLLSNTEQLGTILVELDTLDGGGELPDLEAATGLDIPETNSVVGRTGGDHGRARVDIDSPDGTNVAVVGA